MSLGAKKMKVIIIAEIISSIQLHPSLKLFYLQLIHHYHNNSSLVHHWFDKMRSFLLNGKQTFWMYQLFPVIRSVVPAWCHTDDEHWSDNDLIYIFMLKLLFGDYLTSNIFFFSPDESYNAMSKLFSNRKEVSDIQII